MISNSCGLISCSCGLISCTCGMISCTCGTISCSCGMISCSCGMISESCAMICNACGRISEVCGRIWQRKKKPPKCGGFGGWGFRCHAMESRGSGEGFYFRCFICIYDNNCRILQYKSIKLCQTGMIKQSDY